MDAGFDDSDRRLVVRKKGSSDAPPEPPPRADVPFRLDVLADGYRVVVARQTITMPKKAGEYDVERLSAELKKIKELYPDKNDVTVTVLDELPYESLIGGMDALLGAGFPEIGVATGGSAP